MREEGSERESERTNQRWVDEARRRAAEQMKMNLKNNQFLNIATHYLQIFLIKRQQQLQLEECLIL